MELLPAPLPTTLGYSVAYAGTNPLGWWGFANNTNSILDDSGYSFDFDSFLFEPTFSQSSYYTNPGSYFGIVEGNAPYYFTGDALLTITETNPVPLPSAIWLFGSGLVGLFRVVKRKKSKQ
jgi:hypothetical protein